MRRRRTCGRSSTRITTVRRSRRTTTLHELRLHLRWYPGRSGRRMSTLTHADGGEIELVHFLHHFRSNETSIDHVLSGIDGLQERRVLVLHLALPPWVSGVTENRDETEVEGELGGVDPRQRKGRRTTHVHVRCRLWSLSGTRSHGMLGRPDRLIPTL